MPRAQQSLLTFANKDWAGGSNWDRTFAHLSKLKDSQSRPIFPIARTLEGGFELFGFPIRIAPCAAAIGSTNKSILFGDFSYFVTRRVRDSLRIQRKFETFAEYNQTAFFALTRCNAGLARPTGADSPIKYLVHS